MYSVIPHTLLHAGKSPFREVEDKHERFQKQCTQQAHRKQIYESAQICNLLTTPFKKPNNSELSRQYSVSILSQNKNLEAVRYSVRQILTLPIKQVSRQQLDFCNWF